MTMSDVSCTPKRQIGYTTSAYLAGENLKTKDKCKFLSNATP